MLFSSGCVGIPWILSLLLAWSSCFFEAPYVFQVPGVKTYDDSNVEEYETRTFQLPNTKYNKFDQNDWDILSRIALRNRFVKLIKLDIDQVKLCYKNKQATNFELELSGNGPWRK